MTNDININTDFIEDELIEYLKSTVTQIINTEKNLILNPEKVAILQAIYTDLRKLLDGCNAEYTISLNNVLLNVTSVYIRVITDSLQVSNDKKNLYTKIINNSNGFSQYPGLNETINFTLCVDNLFLDADLDE